MVQRRSPLGSDQLKLLSMMELNGGYWYDGCGWALRHRSQTIQILERLVKRGDVVTTYRRTPSLNNPYAGYTVYQLPWKAGEQ